MILVQICNIHPTLLLEIIRKYSKYRYQDLVLKYIIYQQNYSKNNQILEVWSQLLLLMVSETKSFIYYKRVYTDQNSLFMVALNMQHDLFSVEKQDNLARYIRTFWDYLYSLLWKHNFQGRKTIWTLSWLIIIYDLM